MKRSKALIALSCLCLTGISCQKAKTAAANSGVLDKLNELPEVSSLIKEAIPDALGSTSSTSVFGNGLFQKIRNPGSFLASILGISPAYASTTPSFELVLSDLKALVSTDGYEKFMGSTTQGYIFSLLESLDDEIAYLKVRNQNKTLSQLINDNQCLSNPAQSVSLDLSTVHSDFNKSLEVQCKYAFDTSSYPEYEDSGVLFGKNAAGVYSFWLTLNRFNSEKTGVGMLVTVTNPTTSEKEADILMVGADAKGERNRGFAARFNVKPSLHRIEGIIRSSSSSFGMGIPDSAGEHAEVINTFGHSLSFITDENHIFVKGKDSLSSGTGCANKTVREYCIKASDGTEDTGQCSSLSETFTLTSHSEHCLTFPETSTDATTLFDSFQLSHGDEKTTAVTW
jgi:hypothetical protein